LLVIGSALGQSAAEIKAYQDYLTWTTDYEGLIDGIAGNETTKAIIKFQGKLGHQPTGQLSPGEIAMLREQGNASKNRAGFQPTVDKEAGISLGIPFKLISSDDGKKTKWGTHWDGKWSKGKNWDGRDADLSIDTLRFKDVQLEQLYNRLRTINNRSVQYERMGVDKDWFVIAAFENGAAIYVRAAVVSQPGVPQEIRGFSLWMSKDRPPQYQALAPAMLSSFSTKALAPVITEQPPQASTKPSLMPPRTTGSNVKEAGEFTDTVPPPPLGHIKPNHPAPSALDCLNGLGPIGCPLAFK
jgi:hypothetical protein